MSRIGIMGGTFNPIHKAHKKLAYEAYRQFELDYVIFIPTGDPPHKKGMDITSGFHRYNMVNLCIEDIPYFKISDMELTRKGYSYSYVTLEELRKQYPEDEFYFIIGGDSLFQIEDWREPAKVLQLAVILAAGRNHVSVEEFTQQEEYLEKKYGADIRRIEFADMDISSSDIRRLLAEDFQGEDLLIEDAVSKKDIEKLLDEKVYNYIKENGLYKSGEINGI